MVFMRMQVWSLASLSGLRIQHCHKLGCSLQMWLRSSIAMAVHRLATATLNQPLAWKLRYAADVAIKRKKIQLKNVQRIQIHIFPNKIHIWICQQVHKKVLNVINYQGNVNQTIWDITSCLLEWSSSKRQEIKMLTRM